VPIYESYPHFSDILGHRRQLQMGKGAGADTKAWVWVYEAIMREEGEMICKFGEEFSASVFSGLGRSVLGRALDISNDGDGN
jgi:hypothetical protein